MVNKIDYNASQENYIDLLKHDIEEYCNAHNIDPKQFLVGIDGNKAVSSDFLMKQENQEVLKTISLYFLNLINPPLAQSLTAEVGDGDNFDQLFEEMAPDEYEFIQNLLQDNPELMAFASLIDSDETTTPEGIFKVIKAAMSPGGAVDGSGAGIEVLPYVDQAARDMAEEYNLGPGFESLIGSVEGLTSTLHAVQLDYVQKKTAHIELVKQFLAGDLNETEFEAQEQALILDEQGSIMAMDNILDMTTNIIRAFSEILQAQSEMQLSTVRNISAS